MVFCFYYGQSLLTYDRQQFMDILQSMSKPYGSPVLNSSTIAFTHHLSSLTLQAICAGKSLMSQVSGDDEGGAGNGQVLP